MKLGRFHIGLAEKVKNPPTIELGATGTIIFSGQLSETEYNTDLVGQKAIIMYDKMRKSDGQVKAALLACSLPLQSAHWAIEEGEGPRAAEIAEFVRHNLFNTMTQTFDNLLRHILLMYPFGFSVLEKVWELGDDNKYRWRKFAPRLAKTIYKWNPDDTGGLQSITQLVWRGGGEAGHTFKQIEIPIEKLLVFTLDQEGSNFAGTSLLRAAYKHWYYKDNLYRIDGIAAERHGVGLAVFKIPVSASTGGSSSDWGKIEAVGAKLIAHERAYVAIRDDYDFELKGVTGQLHDIVKSIEHHDMQIARSILAQFINLGANDVGSNALSQDQSSFFLMALKAIGAFIGENFSRFAIKQLCQINWDVDAKQHPKLTVSGLDVRDIGKWSEAISKVINAGAVLPDDSLEAEIRRALKLPAADGEPRERPEKTKQFSLSKLPLARPLHGPERHVAFAEIDRELDDAQDRLVAAAQVVQAQQIDKLVEVISDMMHKGQLDRVPGIDVPFQAAMTEAVEGVLVELYQFGQQKVREELDAQRRVAGREVVLKLQEDPEQVRKFLGVRAQAIAASLAGKLKAAATWEALRQTREGVLDEAALMARMTDLSDRELRSTAKFTVSEAFNMGRKAEGEKQASEISRVIYSAILDLNTCSPCNEWDGREFAYGSTEMVFSEPPFQNCEGEDRCRCIHIYVYKDEA